MNFSKMMKNVKVMDKIIDNKDFKLLEKQDDAGTRTSGAWA